MYYDQGNSSWTGNQWNTTITTGTVVWNGSDLTVRPAPPVPIDTPEKPTDWLRRRIDEMRVDLMAEAA